MLYPNIFLYGGRSLCIDTRRVLRDPGGPPLTESEDPIWTRYYPQPDQPYLVDASDQEFTEFDYVSKRQQDQNPSIFSLLVNANLQLQGVKQRAKQQSDYLPGVGTYINLVEDAVEAIFFVPRGLQKKALPLDLPVSSYSSGQHPSPTTPGPSTQFPGGMDGFEGQHSSGIVEEKRSDSDVESEDHDHDYDSEGVDGPDTINGLTFSEMETVLQRVSDGTISGEERAEAAMLMLGMTGELSLICAVLLSLMPSARSWTFMGGPPVTQRSRIGRIRPVRPCTAKKGEEIPTRPPFFVLFLCFICVAVIDTYRFRGSVKSECRILVVETIGTLRNKTSPARQIQRIASWCQWSRKPAPRASEGLLVNRGWW